MFVVKRNGIKEEVHFDKVLFRLKKLSYDLSIDYTIIARKVISGIYDNVKTTDLDSLAAEISASMSTQNPEYSVFASRISISNIHKNTSKSFSRNIENMFLYKDSKTGEAIPLVSKELYEIVKENSYKIDSKIIKGRDDDIDFFGIKTLEKSYLKKMNGIICETPQYLFMRVALGIHGNDLESALETYDLISKKYFIHATPTLFNAGTNSPQLASCFLMAMESDSIAGIYRTLEKCAEISKHAGGIGIWIHNIRSQGSYIKGSDGISNGIVPMLKVYNETARYVDQGGGKRKGSFAIYLENWHNDIYDFLDLKKNHGKEEMRARDLFYALWVSDLFMKRVESDGIWSLFDPKKTPDLIEVYGEDFENLFEKYEKEGLFEKQISARKLWSQIIDSQISTGMPFILYKDACNRKSNQSNVGVIKSSNLCTEIIQYSSKEETAVCNLASLALNSFVKEDKTFDFEKLHAITQVVTKNLNKVIDVTTYPIESAKKSNFRHRPIGIGVQGLADTFALMRLPYESVEAQELNKSIFETIYHAAITKSLELAKKDGHYETFPGSPMSEGKFQFDLWGVTPSNRFDWGKLRTQIKKYGLRNSLLIAPMPTASTAQIFGNFESFEPVTSNMYVRRVLSGEFIVINKYLIRDLISLGLWDEDLRNQLMANNGSVQDIKGIPDNIKELYKNVWEISQKTILNMAADRGAFICQSQSLNIHISNPTASKITSMHFYGWRLGLKTGMYYLRTKAARNAIQFTVDKTKLQKSKNIDKTDNYEEQEDSICISCGS